MKHERYKTNPIVYVLFALYGWALIQLWRTDATLEIKLLMLGATLVFVLLCAIHEQLMIEKELEWR